MRRRLPMLPVVVLVVLALAYFVYSRPTYRAAAIGHAQLKADALAMVARWKAEPPAESPIAEKYWPESIRKLHPFEVRPHMFGVLALTFRGMGYERGIYIVNDDKFPEEMTQPDGGSGLSNEMIEPGLHYATVKIRASRSMPPPETAADE